MVISLPFNNIWEMFAIGRWELTAVSLQLFSFENPAKTSLCRFDELQVQSSAPCLVLFLIFFAY